ncbi:Coiled-coil domain-containing protein 91, partial [Ophiophagus hannah]
MDDDYFGGFEAADIFFKDGNGEPQTTSPAIPWAAFSTVPEILVPPTVSAELLPEQAPANVPADTQLSPNTLSAADHKEQELEDLLEKHRTLETNYLKEKDDKLISHKDMYNKLQEKHKLELEDLRKAGHEALSIIVEEFK